MPSRDRDNDIYNEKPCAGEMPIDINGWRGRAALEGAWRRLADRLVGEAHQRTDRKIDDAA